MYGPSARVQVPTPPPETDDAETVVEATFTAKSIRSPTCWGVTASVVTAGGGGTGHGAHGGDGHRRDDVGELVGVTLWLLVPPGVVTVTSTVPVAPAGAVAVIDVALLTTNAVAARGAEFTPRWPR